MSTRSPSPTGRKLLRRVVISLVALAVLYIGTTFALSRFLDPEALAAWIEPRMEEAFNRDVEVDRAEVGFLPLGIRLKGVTVADPTGLASHLATVESLDLRIEILPLFRREVRVSRLTVEAPRGDLRVDADGRSNFGDLSAQGSGGVDREGRRPFALNLRSVRVSDGMLRYQNAGEAVAVELGKIRVRASAGQDPEGGWVFVGSSDGDLTVRRGEAAPLLEETPMEFAFDLEADAEFDRMGIRTGEIQLGPVALAVSGAISSLKDPVRTVELDLGGEGIPLADLLAVLPDSIRTRLPGEAEGTLAVTLRVEGEAGPGQLPTVSGQVALTEGRVVRRGIPLAEALTADFNLRPDRSVQTRTAATVLGGPFSLDGTLSTETGMDLALTATSELGRIGSVVELPEGVTARGQLSTQLRIVGPTNDLQALRFFGNVQATDGTATHPSLGVPVEVPAGEVRLDGVKALLQDLPIFLGTDRLTVSGEVPDVFALLDTASTPQFNGSVRGSRLDLTKLSTRPLPDSTLTYGRVAFAKVGGRLVGGRSFQDAARELGLTRPGSLPAAGSVEVAVDTVIDREGRMEQVSARIDFGPSFVRVSEATFNRYGGEIRTSANLSLSPDDAAPFSFRLQVRDLDAGGFLSQTTSFGRFVRGRIGIELDLIGTLDGLLLPDRPALVGSGSFRVTGGGLATAPLTRGLADFLGLENLREPSIQDWGTSFVLEDGRVRLADATVQGAPGTPRVGGSVGLDGGLDLQSVFNLPSERLNTAALERLGVAGEIAANVARRPEVVQAILWIGGSVFDPTIQADPRATALTLGAAVQDEVTREARERIDAQRAEAERVLQEQQAEAQRRIAQQREQLQGRATGFLRGLIRRPDTAQAPPPPDTTRVQVPPDSLRSDTLRPDTLRTDTIRPDTTRPDTLRPDTLRPDTTRPDTVRPDTIRPDTIRPDTIRPDTVRTG